jgi:3-methyladenine DNA glycosylase AlkD
MDQLQLLTQRAEKTKNGFSDILKAADEVFASHNLAEILPLAKELFASENEQVRTLGTFLFGKVSAEHQESFLFMREHISRDKSWRVQEILAMAFDQYCKDSGYKKSLPIIKDWLKDTNPNVRRAVTEGLRIWTTRDHFREHPKVAVKLLAKLKADESEYVRKSVGNALRDISRKHGELIRNEVQTWDISNKHVAQTYKLATRLLK